MQDPPPSPSPAAANAATRDPSHRGVIPVGDDDFDAEVLRAELPVLVEFGATWCPPCRALEPVVARVADELAGRLKVVSVNTDVSTEAAARWSVRGVPTLMLFVAGERRATRLGLASRHDILAMLRG